MNRGDNKFAPLWSWFRTSNRGMRFDRLESVYWEGVEEFVGKYERGF